MKKYDEIILITPLLYSIIISNFSTIKYIVENLNADIFKPDELNLFYPIDYAKEGKDKQIIEFLEKKIILSKSNYLRFKNNYDLFFNFFFN